MHGKLRKGFVLSMDAIIAVLIAITASAAVLAVLSTSESQSYSDAPLYRAAQDVLTLMDKDGSLRGFFSLTDAEAKGEINATFTNFLPPQMGANMTILVYTYNNVTFTNTRNFSFAKGTPGEHVSSARRMFTDVQNSRYGLAIVEVWYD